MTSLSIGGFAHFQGGLLAPLSDPKIFKYFFHMVIMYLVNLSEVKIFE